jgi:hypothetical protein
LTVPGEQVNNAVGEERRKEGAKCEGQLRSLIKEETKDEQGEMMDPPKLY